MSITLVTPRLQRDSYLVPMPLHFSSGSGRREFVSGVLGFLCDIFGCGKGRANSCAGRPVGHLEASQRQWTWTGLLPTQCLGGPQMWPISLEWPHRGRLPSRLEQAIEEWNRILFRSSKHIELSWFWGCLGSFLFFFSYPLPSLCSTSFLSSFSYFSSNFAFLKKKKKNFAFFFPSLQYPGGKIVMVWVPRGMSRGQWLQGVIVSHTSSPEFSNGSLQGQQKEGKTYWFY